MKKLITYFCILTLLIPAVYSAQTIDITSNLVLCLPMNGNGNDYSGNNFNGTLSGPTPTADRFGAANSALHFNGISDFISIPTNTAFTAIESSNELTITGWCNVNNWYQGYNVFEIFEKYDAASDYGWGIGLQNPNTNTVNSGMCFLANAYTQGTYQFIAATSTNFGQWDFYAITWSGSAQLFKAYKNGILVNTVPTGGIQLMPTASDAHIGYSPAGPNEYSDGDIDEVRVYNRALTDQEIAAVYSLTAECDAVTPITFFASSGTHICQGQSVTFTDQSVNNPTSWNWQFPGGAPGTSTLNVQTVLFNTPGTYSVSLTAANNVGAGNQYVATVTVSPIPQLTITSSPTLICRGQQATITVTGATSYTWNTGLHTASIIVTPVSTTNYTVNGVNAGNCTAAVSITQSVSACTGLIENQADGGISVYPNPGSGTFKIKAPNHYSDLEFSLYDLTGRKVFEQPLKTTEVNLEGFAKGLYNYVLRGEGQVIGTGRLSIE